MEQTTAIMNAGTQQITAADITAADVVEMFLAQYDAARSSIELYRRALRQFFAWVERTGRNTQTMTQADIKAYKTELIEDKSPLTAASYLNAVKMFYTWLHDNNATITNIAAGITAPKQQNKFERQPLTAAQACELLDAARRDGSARDYAILSLMLNSGVRTIEVVRADIKDVRKIAGDNVLFVQGKGHIAKDTPVTLSADTMEAIDAYLQTRPTATPDAPLFTCAGNRNKDGRLTTRTISGIARRYLDAMGLTHNYGERNSEYTAHSLRHTYACAMLEDGCTYEDVALMLRHASTTTTKKYVYHMNTEQKLRIAKQHNIDGIYRRAAAAK